jgi:hypothetical protein
MKEHKRLFTEDMMSNEFKVLEKIVPIALHILLSFNNFQMVIILNNPDIDV